MFLSSRRLILLFIFSIALLLIALGFVFNHFLNIPLNNKQIVIFYIPPKSNINSIANKLHRQGTLAYPKLLITFARLEGKAKKIKAGEYKIDPGMTPLQLLHNLEAGKVFFRQFTIIEGWTLKQVMTASNLNPYLSHRASQIQQDVLLKKMGSTRKTLEGSLFPDTYLFAAGVSDVIILKKAFTNMQRILSKAWQNRALDLPYKTPYEALIVASLIEKETAKSEERAKIAGVILRRLKKNMRLQIDASVIYGLGDEYKGKLTLQDLKKDSLFNTYLHDGLPPTPIAMPSLPSIVAALHPMAGTELYYVARGDGSHKFSDTLIQHRNAIQQFHALHLETANHKMNAEDFLPSILDNSVGSDPLLNSLRKNMKPM